MPIDNNYSGDIIIGTNITGNENIIGKNINLNQINTTKVNIDNNILSNLHPYFRTPLITFIEKINELIKEYNISPNNIIKIQESIDDFVKETAGLEPNKIPIEEKKSIWYSKFIVMSKNILKNFPKNETVNKKILNIFLILSPFQSLIRDGIKYVIERIQSLN